MPLNLIGQNKSTISPLGGGQIWFCQVNQDGTPLSSPDTFHQFPILKDSELDDEAPFTEYPAEDGSVYVATAQRKVTLNLTTYQRDTGTLTFAPTDTAGNYYAVLKQVSSTLINGVYQYLFAPLCQIEQSVKYKTLGNEIGVKVWVNPVPANITRSGWTGTTGIKSAAFGASAPSVTVNQGQYYTWYTTAT